MRRREKGGAGRLPALAGVALIAAAGPSALAQRADQPSTAQGVSMEAPAAPVPVTPPPPGFPAYQTSLVFGGRLDTHFQAEAIKPSYSGVRGNAYNDSVLQLFANYSDWLTFSSVSKLERSRNDNLNDYFPDRNAFFRSEALTQRQLYVTVRPFSGLSIYGGKIHPNFGSAYEQAPGIFYNYGTEYEQDERIGIGFQAKLPDWLGLPEARLSVETFYLDTTFLSESLLSRPGFGDDTADRTKRFSRNQYGPSNTGGLASVTVALQGAQPAVGLKYQVSFTREATSDPLGKTEYGVSVGGSFDLHLSRRLTLTPYLEYAHFNNYFGVADLERNYVVAGAAFTYNRWALNLVGGLRKSDGSARATDYQANASVTYEVIPRLLIGAGYNFAAQQGHRSHTVAPSLSYSVSF